MLPSFSGPTPMRRGLTPSSSCSISGWGAPRTTSSLPEAPSSPRPRHMTGRGSRMWVNNILHYSIFHRQTELVSDVKNHSVLCYKCRNQKLREYLFLQALMLALEMEKEVTARMKLMIDVCSEAGAEDYHAGDWLTGTWLEEQYQGQRHLAGLINTYNNFKWVKQ